MTDEQKLDAIYKAHCACIWCGAHTNDTAKFRFISPNYLNVERDLPVCDQHDHDINRNFGQPGYRFQVEMVGRP